ncbi:MAG TPA: HutD family protein [Acidisoma sp.]|uniref:HutD/Ves family protein n=1 Tax=Acidisoma sp. TaxID=1872115 RepID=UPI002BA5B8C9|nr:HutD family protein [Acidisoma sp.]HTI00624.1 HutD family protein [Acidisoma sp.]
MSGWRVLPAAGFQAMPWRNGGGTTWEIARGVFPGSPEADWHWRLSLAEITGDGPFSTFLGIDRLLTVVAGAGINLSIDGAGPRRLHVSEDIEFPGEDRVDCTLVAGPTRDLNLMVDRRVARLMPGRGKSVITLGPGDIAVLYALEEVSLRNDDGRIVVAKGDAVIGEGADEAAITAGRAIWARVERFAD